MYRFALRGKWLVGHVVVLILAGLFVLAGFWQLDRLDQRRAHNADIAARRAQPVTSLDGLLRPSATDPGPAADRPVLVTGRYDPTQQVLVQFRPLNEQTGEYVLTPLVLADRAAVIVNRGWVPASGPETALPPGAAPPQGEVTVTGLAEPGETRRGLGPRDSAEGHLAVLPRIDLPRIQAQVPYDLYPVFVQLATQDPAQAAIPTPVPPEALDDGPHLSYAMQWFSFTAIGLIGWPLVIRRAARDRAAEARRPSTGPGPAGR